MRASTEERIPGPHHVGESAPGVAPTQTRQLPRDDGAQFIDM
jgi:hypothetical protein